MTSGGDKSAPSSAILALRAAGISAVSHTGVDRITVSQICSIAKTTRPTFYSYFGSTDGLLADIWVAEGESFLTRLSEPNYSVLETESVELDRALLEILAVTHRKPEIAEVVIPMMEAWWARLTLHDEYLSLKMGWILGERIGLLMMHPVDPSARQIAFSDPILNAISGLASVKDKFKADLLPGISDPKPRSPSIEETLLFATVNVVANSGVASASLVRICRFAHVTTGTAYPRFPSLKSLILESFEFASKHVVTQNLENTEDGSFGPEEFGLFVNAGLLPQRQKWRDYRIEVHLEARLNNALAQRIVQSNSEVNERVAASLKRYQLPDIALSSATQLIHSIGIGFSLLFNAGIPLDHLDHRRITLQIVLMFQKLVAGSIPVTAKAN